MPAVSYLKAPEYEDGHAGYSDPLDEQRFIVAGGRPDRAVSGLGEHGDLSSRMTTPTVGMTTRMGSIIRQLARTRIRHPQRGGQVRQHGDRRIQTTQGRCGVGPRLPLLVISPWAKQNYVDSTFTEQASIPRFIEDNWELSRIGNGSADASAGSLENMFDFNQSYGHAPAVILNDTTGEIEKTVYPNGSTVTGGQDDAPEPVGTPTTQNIDPTSDVKAATSSVAAAVSTAQQASVKLPKVTCTKKVDRERVVVSCSLKGGSKGLTTLVRARLYRSGKLIANVAHRATKHSTKFSLPLGTHPKAGKYHVSISIDTAGSVKALVRSFKLS